MLPLSFHDVVLLVCCLFLGGGVGGGGGWVFLFLQSFPCTIVIRLDNIECTSDSGIYLLGPFPCALLGILIPLQFS